MSAFIAPGSPEHMRLCACGCGQSTRIAQRTNTAKGHIKGQPHRYIQGHGATCPPPAPRVPFHERFARFVDIGDWHECWFWTGGGGNYGHTKIDGRTKGSHVASYELFHGPVPTGLVVRHTCDRPRCCNPAHLVIGTYADNQRDCNERGRRRNGYS